MRGLRCVMNAPLSLLTSTHTFTSQRERARDTEQIGDAIAELAARIHAATYELLALLRAFDERAGWNCGFLSCAHWLHWRTGIALGAAREKVRVARALAQLPLISTAMQRGELSYAKVRAITRVASAENEARLADVARHATAAQVERLVRAWRHVDRIAMAHETAVRHQQRHLETWVDDDGMVVIRGRLTPDGGAVVRRALEAAVEQLRADAASAADDLEQTPGQCRADALALLAESALAANLNSGHAADRHQVVLHVDGPGLGMVAAPPASRGDAGHAVLEETATRVSAETSLRIACDATLVIMRHGAKESVLDVGRKTRTIPPAIRRALAARDPHCRFPGCTARYCDAHHLRHWAHGGTTRLDNLVRLCRRHHRAVHEDGWTIERDAAGDMIVRRPDGTALPTAPGEPLTVRIADRRGQWTSLREASVSLDASVATPPCHGDGLDIGWAVEVLRDQQRGAPTDCERDVRD
jgi:hypothetical protein